LRAGPEWTGNQIAGGHALHRRIPPVKYSEKMRLKSDNNAADVRMTERRRRMMNSALFTAFVFN
jgi:hypothetical protein